MSHWIRMGLGAAFTVALAILAMVYFRVGQPIFDMATGEYSGEFSYIVANLEVVVPAIIGCLLLATWIWVIVGPVQKEPTARRRPPR